MNPVAVALQRAVSTSRDLESLKSSYDRHIAELQFLPDAECSIVPVPLVTAQAWSKGGLSDLDALLTINGSSEAIFWVTLPNIRAFQAGVKTCMAIYEKGAKAVIVHTSNPVVRRHCLKFGMRETATDENGSRFYGGSDVLSRWLANLTQQS